MGGLTFSSTLVIQVKDTVAQSTLTAPIAMSVPGIVQLYRRTLLVPDTA